jgi:hypothetical protein
MNNPLHKGTVEGHRFRRGYAILSDINNIILYNNIGYKMICYPSYL